MTVLSCWCFFFFFFQAEDGIRDLYVTGVQTCALPIFTAKVVASGPVWTFSSAPSEASRAAGPPARSWAVRAARPGRSRSEERRVGKECRSRGSPDQQKKKSARGHRSRGV